MYQQSIYQYTIITGQAGRHTHAEVRYLKIVDF